MENNCENQEKDLKRTEKDQTGGKRFKRFFSYKHDIKKEKNEIAERLAALRSVEDVFQSSDDKKAKGLSELLNYVEHTTNEMIKDGPRDKGTFKYLKECNKILKDKETEILNKVEQEFISCYNECAEYGNQINSLKKQPSDKIKNKWEENAEIALESYKEAHERLSGANPDPKSRFEGIQSLQKALTVSNKLRDAMVFYLKNAKQSEIKSLRIESKFELLRDESEKTIDAVIFQFKEFKKKNTADFEAVKENIMSSTEELDQIFTQARECIGNHLISGDLKQKSLQKAMEQLGLFKREVSLYLGVDDIMNTSANSEHTENTGLKRKKSLRYNSHDSGFAE